MTRTTGKRVGDFSSQFEALVYMEIARFFPTTSIWKQKTIHLSRQISWCIDFAIEGNSWVYVEAKGFSTDNRHFNGQAFQLKLRMLQDLFPEEAHRLVLVVPNPGIMKNLKKQHKHVVTLNDLPTILRGYTDIKHLYNYEGMK